MEFELLGEAEPWIKNTNDPTWSLVSLPWMAFGYELKMSALQILAFYNAIANYGELVKPRLVDRILKDDVHIKTNIPEVLKPSICSETTINILQDLLIGAVKQGTAKNIYSKKYSCAGKTGTAKIASEGSYGSEYRASFVRYFPAENPKYSCIVVVSKPKKEIGFYGNIVAVFKELRDLLYAEQAIKVPELENSYDLNYVGKANELNQIHEFLQLPKYAGSDENHLFKYDKNNFEILSVQEGIMPNVKGMTAMDVLYLLENIGLDVEFSGKGKVIKQSLEYGVKIKENQKVALTLSS